MLTSLTIRDVVLIDRLELAFDRGLTVLTGETGAGKSILLDALGLAVGERSDSTLVRHGAAQAVVSAEFNAPAADHASSHFLFEQGLPVSDTLVLRRVLNADGRSRGFINDQPVSIGLLKQLGALMVEVQGQFDQRGLLDPGSHRGLFDAFAGTGVLLDEVGAAWQVWRRSAADRRTAEAELARARADEALLRHTLAELDDVQPRLGEETELAERRSSLMHRAQLEEAVVGAIEQLAGDRGAQPALNAASRLIERVRSRAAGQLDEIAAALERALLELDEAASLLGAAGRQFGESGDLEAIEGRLFKLRGLARKYAITVDDLAAYHEEVLRKLATIDAGDMGLRTLAAAEHHARDGYQAQATRLTAARRAASGRLEAAVAAELSPLKLERARFAVTLFPLDEADWGAHGAERVTFEISTNPGAALGPLARIASGGELSRFLLALKVVLARVSSVPTIVFDEVDSGIGGAVADAVGDRLSRLGRELQVLVVTHSPQVAARGDHHWQITKHMTDATAATRIALLDQKARREELARMLSGAQITEEARAAAARLLTRSLL